MLEKLQTGEAKARRARRRRGTIEVPPPPIRLPMRLLMTALALAAACGLPAHAQPVAPTPAQVRPEIDQAFNKLLAAPQVQKAMEGVKADHARAVEDLKALTAIEAPPFKEHKRAEAVLERMKAIGLAARIDAEGNVVALRPGRGGGPKLLVSAHIDTVFPAGTELTVKERDGKLHAPGIADNTRGVTVLLSWLKVLQEQRLQTVGDLLVVANVGEEELGNLRGIKRVFADHPDIDGMVGLEPSAEGNIIVLGTGSHRHEVTFKGPGGHSYVAFGQVPSAIHGLGRAIAKISELKPPSFPKTTFTVGTIVGGTSVNTIAPEARMAIDIRSESNDAMLALERQILAAVDEAVAEENKRWGTTSLAVSTRLIGDRPAGRTAVDSAVVEAAVRSNTAFGVRSTMTGGSTDANVPMALGVPAIVIGSGGKSGGFHALSEWIDVTDAWKGAQSSLATVLGLVGVDGVAAPVLARRQKVAAR